MNVNKKKIFVNSMFVYESNNSGSVFEKKREVEEKERMLVTPEY